MIGPTIPLPAPKMIVDALDNIDVTQSDEGRSGFQMTFKFDRMSPAGMAAEALIMSPLFSVFSRIVLTVIFKGMPHVLMDGVITNQELSPDVESGTFSLTLTGEDISLMLDQEDRNVEHPAQDETIIAAKIIASYAQYGLIPLVIPPALIDPPIPVERTPVQQSTDLQYLNELAERHAYVFYITPGPVPLTNTAYWGPPIRIGIPQKALSVNMGPYSNVDSIDFQHNALSATTVSGNVQDRVTNQSVPVETFVSMRLPLASMPDWLIHRQHMRRTRLRRTGLNIAQAYSQAQAMMDRSMDEVVTVTGEVQAMRYGDVLRPRALVGLRGASLYYDGFYYVKRVTHRITKDSYSQNFTLAREGLGTTTPVVMP
jgi:hypothetical protein